MKNVKGVLKILLIVILISIFTFGCNRNDSLNNSIINNEVSKNESKDNKYNVENKYTLPFEGYTSLEVDGGDLSGDREPNVVVDIGFGDRKYYAFTNEYGQLVKVVAEKIILQDDTTEPVLDSGRYYKDEAKVPGTESKTLDEGHVIADSLGGVSNAYNITPQNSTLNRHGDQAYMEKVIRDADGCTDFVAVITYPNTETQIPSHYSITYTLKGNIINDEFENLNPDEVNSKTEESTDPSSNTNNSTVSADKQISITEIDKKAEYVIIKNISNTDVNLQGWKIVSVTGEQEFTFPKYTLEKGDTITITSGKDNINNGDFYWGKANVWNNDKNDPGELYDSSGNLIDKY